MQIRDFIRKSIFDKLQEIEKDKENMKLKGMEIKVNNNKDIMKWYENEYTLETLKKQFNVKSVQEFEYKYVIKVNNKKASHWFYTTILSKNCLIRKDKNYKVAPKALNEFVEQLYDIMVNGNEEKYINVIKELKEDKVEEMKEDFIENMQPTICMNTEEPKIEFKPIEKAPINSQDDILRKLLINRLTEEEKLLIELFGGKVE